MAELNAEVVITAKDLASGTLDKFGKKLQETQGLSNTLDKAFVAMGGGLLALGGIAFKATQAFGQQEDAMARLAAGLKNSGESIDEQGQALLKQASALQLSTRYADEQIISAQAMLTTFKLNSNQIGQITPKVLDMAEALRKSSGGTIDLEQASILLGKAIGGEGVEGLAGALRRVGVVMTETQTELLKTGKVEDRVAVLTQIMDQNFKGFAEAGGKTFNGQLQIMQNQLGEVMELIGGFVVRALAPMVDKISKATQRFNELTQSMSTLDALKTVIAESLGENSPLTKFLNFMLDHGEAVKNSLFGIVAALIAMKTALVALSIISAITTAFSLLAAVFSAFAVGGLAAGVGAIIAALGGPITLLVLAIGAAVALIVIHWDTIKNAVLSVRDTIINAWNAAIAFLTALPATIGLYITQIVDWFQQIPTKVMEFLGNLFFNWIPFAVAFLVGFLFTAIPSMIASVIDWFQQLPARVSAIWESVKQAVITKVTQAAAWLAAEVSQWPARIMEFIKSIPATVGAIFEDAKQAVVDQMKAMFEGVAGWWDKIKDVLNSIKKAAEDAINAVSRGFEAGKNAGRRQVGGFVSANRPYLVGENGPEVFTPTGGGNITPVSRGGGGNGGGSVALNIYVGLYAGSMTEKRLIAKELYQGLVDLAYSQNKTVAELLGA